MPSFISMALMRSASSFNDEPSFFSLTYQSPSPFVSSYLSPNHPSSITSISIPRLFAFEAISNILSASKSKYVASQLFISIGLCLCTNSPLCRLFLTASWNECVIFSNPPLEYVNTASGSTSSSPAFNIYSNCSGCSPATSLV